MFDLVIFKVPFTVVQYLGLAFIFSIYIFQGIKYLLLDLPREKEKEAEK